MLHILTSIIVTHSDVMTNHVRHRSGQQMGFVHIYVDADANRFVSAYRFWHGHACFTTGKCLSAISSICVGKKSKKKNKSTNGIIECASLPQKYIHCIWIVYEYLYARKQIFFWNTLCTHVPSVPQLCMYFYICIYICLATEKKTLAKITTTQKNKTKLQIDEQNNNAEKAL